MAISSSQATDQSLKMVETGKDASDAAAVFTKGMILRAITVLFIRSAVLFICRGKNFDLPHVHLPLV